jgi:hypothetical protein
MNLFIQVIFALETPNRNGVNMVKRAKRPPNGGSQSFGRREQGSIENDRG